MQGLSKPVVPNSVKRLSPIYKTKVTFLLSIHQPLNPALMSLIGLLPGYQKEHTDTKSCMTTSLLKMTLIKL